MKKSVLACLCLLFALAGAYCAETVLGAWGDRDHQVAVILDGKRYFIQSEMGRLGPFDYVSPHARGLAATNRCFVAEIKKQSFLVSSSGEKLGPYSYISADPSGRLFLCCHTGEGRLYDLYYDDGAKLVLMGISGQIIDSTDSYLSADGRHSAFFAGGLLNEVDNLFFDGFKLPVNHSPVIGIWDIGFVGGGSRLWFRGEESAAGGLLLFVEPDAKDGKPLVSALTEAPGYEGNRMPFPEALLGLAKGLDGREPLRLSVFGDYCRTLDRKWMALRLKGAKGWYFYGGGPLYGPYEDDAENAKLPIAISRDGSSIAYVTHGRASGPSGGPATVSSQLRYLVYRNGALLGAHDAQKISAIDIAEGSGACVYIVQDASGKYAVWVDGKPVIDGCDAASLRYVEDFSAPNVRGEYLDWRFLGHFSVRKDGQTRLYCLDTQLGSAFAHDGYFYLRKRDGSGGPVGFYIENLGDGQYRLVSGASTSEAWSGIMGLRMSDASGITAFGAKDAKGKWNVVVGGKRFGPYDGCSAPSFLPGSDDAVFFYSKGRSWFLGRSDGTSSPLPGFGYAPRSDTDMTTAPVVSPDGRVVEYPAAGNFYYYYTGKSFLVDSRRILVDGMTYSGAYDPAARVTVFWDEKAKAFVTIAY